MIQIDKERWGIIFAINAFAVIFFFFPLFFFEHYGLDDYLIINVPGELHYNALRNGRYALMLVYDIFAFFHFNPVVHQKIMAIIFGLAMILCVTCITKRICELGHLERKSQMLLVDIASLLLFSNVFMVEWFSFVLSYSQWILAIIGVVFGAIYLSYDELWKKVLGVLFIILAANSYQVILAYYAILIMILLYLKNQDEFNILKLMKETVVAAVVAAFAMFGNIVLTNYFMKNGVIDSASRYNTLSFSIENIIGILGENKNLWIDGLGLLPHGILLITLVILLFVLIFVCCANKVRVGEAGYCLLIFLGCLVVIYFPQMLDAGLTPRSVLPIFGLFSICLYFIVFWSEKISYAVRGTIVLAGLFWIVNLFYCQKAILCIFQLNALEAEYALAVENEIRNYEEKTGEEIMYVGFEKDKAPQWKYDTIPVQPHGEMLNKAYMVSWGDVYTLNYYTNLGLEKVECDRNVKNYFHDNDWDAFMPEEQLIFEKNTVYVCLY